MSLVTIVSTILDKITIALFRIDLAPENLMELVRYSQTLHDILDYTLTIDYLFYIVLDYDLLLLYITFFNKSNTINFSLYYSSYKLLAK
jgi:hypothetical protein